LVHYRARLARQTELRAGRRCPAFPGLTSEALHVLRPGDSLMFSFGLLTSSCEAQQRALPVCAARSLVPKGSDAILWEALWMGRIDELTSLDSYDAMRSIDWLGWLLS